MGLVPEGPLEVEGSEEDLVYALDPDVTPPAHLVASGWVAAKACETRKGADTVRTRILRPKELRAHRAVVAEPAEDGGGELAGYHFALTRAVLSVNGKRKDIRSSGKTFPTISAYLDTLMAANGKDARGAEGQAGSLAYQLLALRVLARSNSKPLDLYHRSARALLGADEPEPEEVADAGASKSGDPAGG